MKIKHVRHKSDFFRVISEGKKQQSGSLVFYLLQKSDSDAPQVGLIITKELIPKATQRNYIRRVIYTAFRERVALLSKEDVFVVKLVKSLKDLKEKTLGKKIRDDISAFFAMHRR